MDNYFAEPGLPLENQNQPLLEMSSLRKPMQYAPGTQDPNAQGMSPQQEALINALRGMGGGGGAPAQFGNVQSAGYIGQGMDTKAIGNALGTGISKLGSMFGGGYSAPADLAGTEFI